MSHSDASEGYAEPTLWRFNVHPADVVKLSPVNQLVQELYKLLDLVGKDYKSPFGGTPFTFNERPHTKVVTEVSVVVVVLKTYLEHPFLQGHLLTTFSVLTLKRGILVEDLFPITFE
jgi:hypothetical protein